jgi:site-specific recombinase XerD
MTEINKAAVTIMSYECCLRHLLEHLDKISLSLRQITNNNVTEAVVAVIDNFTPNSARTTLSVCRGFLRFLYRKNLTEIDLSYAVPPKGTKKTTVTLPLTQPEINRLMAAHDTNTPVGKRNYAIFLLALRTGLRSIDIADLKFSEIDWRNATLHLAQKKTERNLILPLLADVGNALSDYILHARPQSESGFVFLQIFAPYKKITTSAIRFMSHTLFKKADIARRKTGLHQFRYSLATKMLDQQIPLPVIADALGHSSELSTKPYLAINISHLRKCALTLDGVEPWSGVAL